METAKTILLKTIIVASFLANFCTERDAKLEVGWGINLVLRPKFTATDYYNLLQIFTCGNFQELSSAKKILDALNLTKFHWMLLI